MRRSDFVRCDLVAELLKVLAFLRDKSVSMEVRAPRDPLTDFMLASETNEIHIRMVLNRFIV